MKNLAAFGGGQEGLLGRERLTDSFAGRRSKPGTFWSMGSDDELGAFRSECAGSGKVNGEAILQMSQQHMKNAGQVGALCNGARDLIHQGNAFSLMMKHYLSSVPFKALATE